MCSNLPGNPSASTSFFDRHVHHFSSTCSPPDRHQLSHSVTRTEFDPGAPIKILQQERPISRARKHAAKEKERNEDRFQLSQHDVQVKKEKEEEQEDYLGKRDISSSSSSSSFLFFFITKKTENTE